MHTHCLEAINFARPDARVAGRIVTRVKEQGLDGIAITDHAPGTSFAYQIRDIVARTFNNGVVIIPGSEVCQWPYHVVELYLPGDCTFRFIAHPSLHSLQLLEQEYASYIAGIHGVEIENGNYWIDKEEVTEFAHRHGLLLLSNSDAHSLTDIGRHYNEVDMEGLCSRAKGVC